jgi:hypothetical protein
MTDPTPPATADLSPEALDAAEALALNIIGGTFIADALTALRARLAEAEAERMEQARLLGRSAEVELALRARLKEAEARAERAEAAVERAVGLALERAAGECDDFDAPPSRSDFVMGQATAAQQIRARIRGRIRATRAAIAAEAIAHQTAPADKTMKEPTP